MRNPRGIALASVLFCLAGLLVVSTTLFFTIFLDGRSTTNVALGQDALYIAEAGIHHLWSTLMPAPDFAEALGWPAGEPPFGSPVWFPAPPRTYRVRVTAGEDRSLVAVSEGTSGHGTRTRVEAMFRRESRFRPSGVVVLTDAVAAGPIVGAIGVSTADRDGTDRPLAAIAAESRDSAERMQQAAGADARVIVAGPSGLAEAAARLRAAPDRTLADGSAGGPWGTSDTPEVTWLTGPTEIAGEVFAAGIVVADGRLRIRGRLEVEGLLLAAGGVDIEGELVVHGALQVAESLAISDTGTLSAEYSSRALARADALRPDVLPRAAVLGAWRELW